MSNDDKKPLGRIPLQQKLVARPAEGERVATKEVDALRALSQQHGVPGIDLTQVAIHLEHLELVPRELAESHLLLPALVKEDRIFLAMATPNDKRVVDELEFVTGKKVYPYVALSTTLERTIRAAYDARDAGEAYYVGPNVPQATLEQLGLVADKKVPAARAREEREEEKKESIAPGAPAVVLDQAAERASWEAELQTGEFGALEKEEVSTVKPLPEELRGGGAAVKVMPGSGSKVILVVDDEEDIRKLLRRLLADKGHRVVEADRGLLALRMVKEHTPDLIILDAMLPELHGFDIARRIKGSERYGAIPIIMVSAVYRGWRIAEDLKNNYGIEEYIEKPFRITEVLKAVQRLLSDRDQRRKDAPLAQRDPEAMSAEAETALADGIAAYKSGRIDDAIEHLKRGVHIDPLAYRLRYHLALLYGKKGLVYEGIGELERAVDLNPRHFPALKNLAVLYEKAGFKHKAIEMWERSTQAAPDDATRETIKKHLMDLL